MKAENTAPGPGTYVLVGGFILVIHLAWWAGAGPMPWQGGFVDGDSYTRLLRVERLVETGAWLDVAVPGINAPYGTMVHWTRLFDMVLLVLALPMIPVLGTGEALFWAGAMVSPLIHTALAVALVWATWPLLGSTGAGFAGALTAGQFGILAFAVVGRADHHMMFPLFLVLALGFLVRSYGESDGGREFAHGAGLSLALGMWEGPEFILFLALSLAVTGLPWLTGGDGERRRNLWLTQALVLGLAAAMLVERGPAGLTAVEYDRISAVHLSLAFLVFLFWQGQEMLARHGVAPLGGGGRFVQAALGAPAVAGLMRVLYPKIFANPLDDADPDIFPIYDRIAEYSAVEGIGGFLVYFGSAVIAVPWLLWRLRTDWPDRQRWTWLLIGAALVLYLALAMNWVRWSLYGALFFCVVLADAAARADSALTEKFAFPARVPLKVLVLLIIAVGPLMLGAAIRHGEKTPEETAANEEASCPLRPLTAFLNAPPWSEGQHIVVASANFGPEILYRTGQCVVATVHHRNVDGMLDGYRILAATSDADARAIVERRGVDLLLLCPGSKDDSYFLLKDAPELLYRRLERGEPPSWLAAVPLPESMGGKLKLFEVK